MTTREDIDRIRQHPVWEEIHSLRDRVREASPSGPTDRETLARVEAVLAYAAAYRNFPSHLFPSTWDYILGSVNASLSYVSDLVERASGPEPLSQNAVNNIDTYLDQILDQLRPLPQLQKESRAAVISEAGAAFRVASEASLTALDEKVQALQEQINEGRDTVNEMVQTAARTKADSDAVRAEFETALLRADTKAAEALGERIRNLDEKASSQSEKTAERAKEIIRELAAKNETARTLLEHVADASVAGGYQKYANKEAAAFRVWNALGLGIAALVAIYLGIRFWDIEDLTVQESILRAAISLPGLALAAYCLRQASVRQKQSVDAKYRELDLIALPPFTDKMEDAQRSQLRMLLGERIFGHPVQDSPDERATANPLSGVNLDDLAKLVQALRS